MDRLAPTTRRGELLVADHDAALFAGPLVEVVAGAGAFDRDSVAAALHAAAADDLVAGLPHGLDSAVAADGRNLSGGQRQRVRLARALAARPRVLIAVDPTSAVDAQTETIMAERLLTARRGLTTVVVTTSPVLLALADHVLVLRDGTVRAQGTHRELLERDPAYRELMRRGPRPAGGARPEPEA